MPEAIHVRFVEGDESVPEVTLQTIEERGSRAWIEQLAFAGTPLAIKETRIEEFPEPDPALIRRLYSFVLTPPNVSVGTHRGRAEIKTAEPFVAEAPIEVMVQKLDRIAIVPNPLVIRKREHRTVTVVFRRGEGSPALVGYDHDLLDVRRLGRAGAEQKVRVARYELSPQCTGPFETTIEFAVGAGERREVVVRVD